MQEALISDIRNFTSTGYRSDMFNQWVKQTPYESEMGIIEFDDYE
jgi:hypothetical protein